MCRDPLIIGGGPAGTAAAITLARAGHRPILLERTTGPTDKVCGDFLSHDTIQRASQFGVDPAALGAAAIHRVRIITGRRVVESALPFPALGLSRRILDAALLGQAAAAGAIIHTGETVRRLTPTNTTRTNTTRTDPTRTDPTRTDPTRTDPTGTDPTGIGTSWIVQSHVTRTAQAVFLATGKHDLRDLPRQHTRDDSVGLKTYLALGAAASATLAQTTELTLFPGGYAGMQPVEHQKTVLCIAVRRSAFQHYGGTWTSLLAAIQAHSPRFGDMLHGACPILPRPLAVAGIPYGYAAPPGPVFRLGDQAAVIPSLTGDGMAIALLSGQHAAQAWLDGGDAHDYLRSLTRTLAPQMRLARALHTAGTLSRTQAAVIPALRLVPGLLRWAATHTRVSA